MAADKAETSWKAYPYSVVRLDTNASMLERVNIGIILADRDEGKVHRRLISADEARQRDAEPLAPCPVAGAIGAAACGDGSGDPAESLRRLHTQYGGSKEILRVTEPKCLWLEGYDHECAAEWLYETTIRHDRGLTDEHRERGASCKRHPNAGEYTFVVIQYVPDLTRDEAVNVGFALADAVSRRTIVRYASGGDLERLGTGRFAGAVHMPLAYERWSRVEDVDAYLRDIAEPDMSSLRCSEPREAHGSGPGPVLDRLYARLVAHAPHHDGGRLLPQSARRRAA